MAHTLVMKNQNLDYNTRIEALCKKAAEADDADLVFTCVAALEGDQKSLNKCLRLLSSVDFIQARV